MANSHDAPPATPREPEALAAVRARLAAYLVDADAAAEARPGAVPADAPAAPREAGFRARMCEAHVVDVVKAGTAGWLAVAHGGAWEAIHRRPTRAAAEDAVLDALGVPRTEPLTMTPPPTPPLS